MTPVAERCGLSIRAQLQVTSALIVNSGGSINDVPLSVGSIYRHRLQAREQVATQLFNKWQETKPKHPVLHCDSKLIEYLSGDKEERIAVCISGTANG